MLVLNIDVGRGGIWRGGEGGGQPPPPIILEGTGQDTPWPPPNQ